MTGIMLKDLKEAFCLKKNIIAWVFSILTYLIIVIVMHTKYIYILYNAVGLPMIGSSVLQYSTEQDEISKFNKIMLTYPVTRREIILSKYLSGMLLQLLVFLIGVAMALLFSFGFRVIDFSNAMEIWFLGVILSFLFMAVNYMIFFWLGQKRGSILYLIFVIIIVVTYVLTYFNTDFSIFSNMNTMTLLAIGFLVSVLVLIGSYFASLKIFTKNHII